MDVGRGAVMQVAHVENGLAVRGRLIAEEALCAAAFYIIRLNADEASIHEFVSCSLSRVCGWSIFCILHAIRTQSGSFCAADCPPCPADKLTDFEYLELPGSGVHSRGQNGRMVDRRVDLAQAITPAGEIEWRICVRRLRFCPRGVRRPE